MEVWVGPRAPSESAGRDSLLSPVCAAVRLRNPAITALHINLVESLDHRPGVLAAAVFFCWCPFTVLGRRSVPARTRATLKMQAPLPLRHRLCADLRAGGERQQLVALTKQIDVCWRPGTAAPSSRARTVTVAPAL